ncbi:uncharacterized protein LOC107817164 [Nicotiana tabacum]|uniref:Uncharacterized protein LOC107817164 n=2 Tax=Nicotiana TaxID=4085 RepID=A0A1S4CBC9_TOBAC|nr:PREDICTED: uncharacterized protein LOC104216608 [Nicotiana sylvestris]XP_016498426.1 PREDICTED: uncharacterized protein LOC107817164 [Nicotiana tabacum]
MRRRLKPRVPPLLLLFYSSILLSSLPGLIAAAIVTLDSIEIYNTHELLGSTPEVYFECKGENRTNLPDVKKKHELYTFKGEESWQPLTELEEKKCKRCGIYEKDSFIKPDDVFDEWEFCASDFTRTDGKYIHFKEKEFNATFLCPDCVPLEGASNHSAGSQTKGKGMHWVLVLLICVVVSTFVVLGAVTAYKYWQKRKKQQDQARFLKLFEDGDDIEDDLGIGPLSHVI